MRFILFSFDLRIDDGFDRFALLDENLNKLNSAINRAIIFLKVVSVIDVMNIINVISIPKSTTEIFSN